MVSRVKIVLATALAGTLVACGEKAKKNDSAQAPAADKDQSGTSTGTGTGTGTGSSSNGGDGSVEVSGKAFYTGFDGSTDLSLLLPGFRKYEIEDSSIAKVEAVEVVLSDTTIASMLAQAKKDNPNFNEETFKKAFSRKRTTYKIVPLKAGTTNLIAKRPDFGGRGGASGASGPGGPGGPGGGGRDPWGTNENTSLKLVVTQYTKAQIDAGKKRYETDGAGNLKACKSCHETGAEGAPPHELGRIMEISDAQALNWITTGKVNSRVAKIKHTWEFSSDDQKKGIVAYVRSKQTHDVEALTKLYFEEGLLNFGYRPPKDGTSSTNGDGTATGSSTSTGTGTGTRTGTGTGG